MAILRQTRHGLRYFSTKVWLFVVLCQYWQNSLAALFECRGFQRPFPTVYLRNLDFTFLAKLLKLLLGSKFPVDNFAPAHSSNSMRNQNWPASFVMAERLSTSSGTMIVIDRDNYLSFLVTVAHSLTSQNLKDLKFIAAIPGLLNISW